MEGWEPWPYTSFSRVRRVPREKGCASGPCVDPPCGVPKSEFTKRNYQDVWSPAPDPSDDLVTRGGGHHEQRQVDHTLVSLHQSLECRPVTAARAGHQHGVITVDVIWRMHDHRDRRTRRNVGRGAGG